MLLLFQLVGIFFAAIALTSAKPGESHAAEKKSHASGAEGGGKHVKGMKKKTSISV